MTKQAKVSTKGRQKKPLVRIKFQGDRNPPLPGPDGALPPFTVIYIHGIGNQPDAPVLKINWDKALFGMDMGERTRMAYWSDITHPRPGAGTRSQAVSMMEGNSIENEDLSPFEASELLRTLGPDARNYAQALSKRLIAEINVRTITASRFESKILPGFIRKPVTECQAWHRKSLDDSVTGGTLVEKGAALAERSGQPGRGDSGGFREQGPASHLRHLLFLVQGACVRWPGETGRGGSR
jgi:hypothetical protein